MTALLLRAPLPALLLTGALLPADVQADVPEGDDRWSRLCAGGAPQRPPGEPSPALLNEACERLSWLDLDCTHPTLRAAALDWAWGRQRGELLTNLHDVLVPHDGFVLLPWHEEQGVRTVALDLGAQTHAGVRIQSRQGLEFPVDEATRETLERLDGLDRLGLRLIVELEALHQPRQPVCVDDSEGDRTVPVVPVWAALVDLADGRSVVQTIPSAGRDAQVRIGQPPHLAPRDLPAPRARVLSLHAECGMVTMDTELVWLALRLEDALSVCWLEALSHNAHAHGVVTMAFDLDPDQPRLLPRVLIDLLDNPRFQDCAAELLPRIDIPSGLIGEPVRLRASVSLDR
jgi:hypothetical protein